MQISKDIENDITYIRLKAGTIEYTKEQDDWLLFDCDKNGTVLGVEILFASRQPSENEILQKYALVDDDTLLDAKPM